MRRTIALILLAAAACAAQHDPKQRARYARDLADQGQDALPKLAELLADPSEDVRLEAVKSIGTIGTQRSLDPLLRAAADNDPNIQIRAVDAIVNFYLPGYMQSNLQKLGTAVKSRFTDTNADVIPAYVKVRDDVVIALGKVARGGASMESRANAARALGILRGRAAVPDIIEALRTKDDAVLYESLVALQKIRDVSAAPRIAFLLRDLNEKVQIAAIETTGLLQNQESASALRKVYVETSNGKVRRAAAAALAMLPSEENRALYRKAFVDKDAQIRAAGAEGLGRLRNKADAGAIEKAFSEDGKMHARLANAFALVLLGRTEISEFSPLQYLINTLNSRAYKGVAEAYLIELTREPAIRETAHHSIRNGTRDEKVGLSRVLAASGDASSVAPLDALTKDPDTEVAEASVRALRTLKARL